MLRTAYLFLVPSLLLGACVSDPVDSVEDLEDEASEANGPIFPPDDTPQYSCALGVAPSCGSRINFGFKARSSWVRETYSERIISDTAVAVISGDGSTIHCQPASGVEVRDIPSRTVDLPDGVTEAIDSANKGVYYYRGRDIVPVSGSLFQPLLRDPACASVCDLDSLTLPTPCPAQPVPTADDAQITYNNTTTRIDMDGQVQEHGTDPLTGITSLTCRMTLPANRIKLGVNTRPRDFIGVSRGRFVRGFELKGAALQTACADISNRVCNGNAQCATTKTAECVNEFAQPDPCDPSSPR